MAYKQPRVPPMREEGRLAEYIRELILFLKDFCMETWMQVRQAQEQAAKLKEEIQAIKAKMDERA